MVAMSIKKIVLVAVGCIFLALGAIGVVLPVLPTTPFVLVSAACFGASSERLYGWLLRNRVFGPFIENYRTRQGISILHKAGSIAFLWTGLIISMVSVGTALIYIVLGIVGIGVTVHLLMIKTKKKNR